MKRLSPIFAIDGYKLAHANQYPEGTSLIYGNFVPRNARRFSERQVTDDPKILSFGFQAFVVNWIKEEFDSEFFQKDESICEEMKRSVDRYLGKDYDISRIKALHKLGYLPLEIKVVPEGEVVDVGTPMLTIKNTHPDFFWLVNYLETLISAEMWPIITSATTAFHFRLLCEQWAIRNCDDNSHVDWQGHDFSSRGDYGIYASAIAGMAHLSVFQGTDSVFGREMFEHVYKTERGGSVDATEHSVMCMGMKDGELDTVRRLITETTPTGIVSIVNDTWDTWNHVDNILRELKDVILSRDGKVVTRPDSGDPADILCGLPVICCNVTKLDYHTVDDVHDILCQRYDREITDFIIETINGKKYIASYLEDKDVGFDFKWSQIDKLTPEMKGVVQLLDEIFGHSVNSKGFKVLDPHVGVLYGDSITKQRANEIMERLHDKGYASSAVVFGVGAFTYQYITRDTFGFAIKATYGVVNGEAREVMKDPITDPGKKSLTGLIYHYYEDGVLKFKDKATVEEEENTSLLTIFKDGEVTTTDWSEIESRIKNNLKLYI
ncbi:nicotinamide phosphoribosyl transferase [Cronobacter phage vB_CsaP_009]|uniref:Nicotinamide phosphoribosyltransferase n=1 Tax=Cronobacter phage vB_CsaP_009 TaxID=2699738 RepID=A0A679FBU3_9CAUD|nr:nicotinamide phosphoribosyl transferase [Cronobacter phage vB_CsaP_009]BBU72688.1 nicotinamide phosphoribosyl transferase [Cronobacter phage vB_CsaP_009]